MRGVLDFLFVKYNVADEGGEMAMLNLLYRQFPHLAPLPFKVEIEHTTVCNKRCIMCEHTYWKNEPSYTMTLEQLKGILDKFPKLRWINITGEGSGFLNPDFEEMLKLLRSRRVSVNFVDELEFMTEERAKSMIDMGVNCIWCSMDGATKETYEKVKVGCEHDKVIENIKTLVRLKKEAGSPFPALCFRFIASTLNVHEMPMMPKVINDLGVMGEGSKLEFVGVLKFPEIEKFHIKEMPAELVEQTRCEAAKYNIPVSFSHAQEDTLPPLHKMHCLGGTLYHGRRIRDALLCGNDVKQTGVSEKERPGQRVRTGYVPKSGSRIVTRKCGK